MVVDSGFRCHLTSFTRATAAEPSAFVQRLRKFLKTRRVTSVSQIGTDRIIELQFNDGQYRLFLEFYAGGNIVLTDSDRKVLALLRRVSEGEAQEELREGVQYSIENRQNYAGVPPLSTDRVRDSLKKAISKGSAGGPTKKQKKKPGDALIRALVPSFSEYPSILIDHSIRAKGFDPAIPLEDIVQDNNKVEELFAVLDVAKSTTEEITALESSQGFIIAKPAKRHGRIGGQANGDDTEGDKENVSLIYEDFHPFKPLQSEDTTENHILRFDGFNKTVDEFFSSVESQTLKSRLTEREENARKKLENARMDQQKRVGGLQQVQEMNVRKAQAIEGNLRRVQEAIAAVNGLIAQGMDWTDIARLIEMEKERQNPVATMIKLPLKLYENSVTLLLAEGDFADEEDSEADQTDSEVSDSGDNGPGSKTSKPSDKVDKRLAVDIDLALSPWANAGEYYDQQKSAAVKEKKTLQSSELALRSAEKKITADLKKGLQQEKQVLRAVRKQLWFEKFYYFVSSEGYLVLGGRDSQQSEILYKKHLTNGDVYINADLDGAVSIIVKNRQGLNDSPIPPSTLSQAGSFCVATSIAWDSKAIMAAWWVDAAQVSKTASTGDFLEAGKFAIKGEKNYLPPSQLLLGFGIMFRISEESKARHLKHRAPDERQIKTSSSEVKTATDGGCENASDLEKEDFYSVGDNQHEKPEDQQDQRQGNQHEEPETHKEDSQAVQKTSHEIENIEIHEDQDYEANYHNPLQSDQGQAPRTEQIPESDSEVEDEINYSSDEPSAKHPEQGEAGQSSKNSGKVTTNDPSIAESTTASQKPKQAPQVRGKQSKRAKLKNKYADQDEEDRALALRLLGTTSAQQKTAEQASNKATREAELKAQKERRREQHQRAQQSGKAAEEARRRDLEAGTLVMDEEEQTELNLVDCFVGTPLPEDEILDCFAVCGPWEAIGTRFRWRTKMQPGAQKKGKAVKEILGAWGRDVATREKRRMPEKEDERYEEEKLLRKEGELVKGLRDAEVVGIVPVKGVRIAISGGAEAGKGGKKGVAQSARGKGSKKAR